MRTFEFIQASRILMTSSAAGPTSSRRREMTYDTRGKNVEVRRNGSPTGMPDVLGLIRVAASETRRQILSWLPQGFDHPEDSAQKLEIRRQSDNPRLD